MGFIKLPRIMIAGLGGDSGKTFVSCGLLRYFMDKGLEVSGFKKGPDYIDSAWLKLASKKEVRNLDTYLIPKNEIIKSFIKNGTACDISIIEGNRGLFDGYDSKGSHSTAELAKLLGCPVVLVLTVKKITRTSAALVLGCKLMDKDLNIAGVIINQLAGKRHESIIRETIEDITGIPVIGAIPKLNSEVMPSRHLGLITPDEYELAENAIKISAKAINDYVDTEKLLNIAKDSSLIQDYKNESDEKNSSLTISQRKNKIRIGYFCDRIFSFYYPENLESLADLGVELIKISSYNDKILPEIDALYIGGGFPESNIELLTSNKELMMSLKSAVESGLPVYAECGGLIYLGESINIDGKNHQLSGILPIKFMMSKKPMGHGYSEAIVDNDNPFFSNGTVMRSHEFHYSFIDESAPYVKTCLKVQRGVGAIDKRDGIIYKNVFGTYLHIHALGFRQWAEAMLNQANKYRVELCRHKKMQ
ncbi:hydrogenobyrinic acid a,c-diamide synthase (glutamine-hydrolyzing) [Bacteroidetes/Chlorobi group bacterium ChocPot_Mid]|jgi:cobyrinic acid a,c-diamide synthase|nr:MAG: hydrogenobyrinic acid a,c-diamide synthase (glutamine-hydrolyzing) [Bacteroidetes/Chlorobi group bacterium ChocPot_Mid]